MLYLHEFKLEIFPISFRHDRKDERRNQFTRRRVFLCFHICICIFVIAHIIFASPQMKKDEEESPPGAITFSWLAGQRSTFSIISTEGAHRLTMTYESHPSNQPNPIPSVRHIALNELNRPKICFFKCICIRVIAHIICVPADEERWGGSSALSNNLFLVGWSEIHF